jgi:hypothetical protein
MPIIHRTKYNSPYRINDFSLIKFAYPFNENKSFYEVNIMSDLGDSDRNTIQYSDLDRIDNIVWNGGSSEYKHIVNRFINDGTPIFTPINIINNQEFIKAEVFLTQGFNWNNRFGVLVVVRGSFTGTIFYSKLLKTNDFNISQNKILQYGTFWMESHIFEFPLTNEELSVQIVDVRMSDITNINIGNIPSKQLINSYPFDFVPLIQEKPLPDFIVTDLSIDVNYFLHILPKTLENKNLENSLKDYFDIPRDQLTPILISHIIQYSGINQTTSLLDWKYLRVSNEENNFNEVVIGLDFSDWIDLRDPSQTFQIDVSTEFMVDGKLMRRASTINVSFQAAINLFNQQNIAPTNVIFNEILEPIQVNQTVIEKPLQTQIVKVIQPIFIEFITNDIQFANKNITFEGLIENAYMVVTINGENQILYSQKTSDGKIFFDLSKINVTSDGIYNLFLQSSDQQIGSGTIIK